jgi:CubicO group peptidase (beta-lactamase class C family)
MLTKVLAGALLVLHAMVASLACAAGAPLPSQWDHLVSSFDQRLAGDRIVGGSIALVQDGRIVAHREYGYADLTGGRKVSPDTLFHWASNTKTLNAISIMQARDRGLLRLSDPVTRYVPELRQVHNPFGSMDDITLAMLMTHTAGFQGATWPYKQNKDWEPFEPTRWSQLLAMMPYQEIEFAPGSRFGYSNPAWVYLAHTLEDLTDEPWQYYIQKNIFAPLGMAHSYFGNTPAWLRSERSHNYSVSKDDKGHVITTDGGADFDPGITIPNGGWNAPLADLATYIGFLTGAGRQDPAVRERYEGVLRRATLEEMWQPRVLADEEPGH